MCGGKTNHDKCIFPFKAVVLRRSGEMSISVSKQKDTVTFKHYNSLFGVRIFDFCCLCSRLIYFFFKFSTIFNCLFLFFITFECQFYKFEKKSGIH